MKWRRVERGNSKRLDKERSYYQHFKVMLAFRVASMLELIILQLYIHCVVGDPASNGFLQLKIGEIKPNANVPKNPKQKSPDFEAKEFDFETQLPLAGIFRNDSRSHEIPRTPSRPTWVVKFVEGKYKIIKTNNNVANSSTVPSNDDTIKVNDINNYYESNESVQSVFDSNKLSSKTRENNNGTLFVNGSEVSSNERRSEGDGCDEMGDDDKADVVDEFREKIDSDKELKTKKINQDCKVDLNTRQYHIQLERMRRRCICRAPGRDRIVGGTTTKVKNYPWTVQLVRQPDDTPICGGTIINQFYILTAAHCLIGLQPSNIVVRVGHTSPESPGRTMRSLLFKRHQRFNEEDLRDFDIALIKVRERIRYNIDTRPACLPGRGLNILQNRMGFITGWGATSEGGFTSEVLKVATVSVSEYQICQRMSSYPPRTLHERIICANDNNTDGCQGDSGGPLAIFNGNNKKNFVVGVSSYGFGCARPNFPGVYTKVSKYRRWIKRRVRDAPDCQ